MRVFLTGATGFVGGHLLERLLSEGHSVTALVRDPNSKKARTLVDKSTSANAYLRLVQGDVADAHGLENEVRECDAVVHLVGIIAQVRNDTFERVHVRGTENVVNAAKRAGVSRFVQMSAIGARPDGVSEYQTSKYRAEEAVRSCGIPFVILRPSIIFGPGDGFVSQMVQVMKSAPFIRPVVGSGRSRFRPIHVGDVGRCFVDALTSDATLGKTIHLVGGEELTFEELLDRIATCVGVRKRPLHIPIPLMMLAAHVFSLLPARPPVTPDQLAMLEEGSTADPKEMLQVFNLEPISFTEGIRAYLCTSAAP